MTLYKSCDELSTWKKAKNTKIDLQNAELRPSSLGVELSTWQGRSVKKMPMSQTPEFTMEWSVSLEHATLELTR
jgi:hypothetical protein